MADTPLPNGYALDPDGPDVPPPSGYVMDAPSEPFAGQPEDPNSPEGLAYAAKMQQELRDA